MSARRYVAGKKVVMKLWGPIVFPAEIVEVDEDGLLVESSYFLATLSADAAWGKFVQTLDAKMPRFFVPNGSIEYILFSDDPKSREPRITALG